MALLSEEKTSLSVTNGLSDSRQVGNVDGHAAHRAGRSTDTEKYMPCMSADTRIKSLRGEMRAGDLRPGDMVLTRDAGYQPVRWIGAHTVSLALFLAEPELRPVRIRSGALGRNQPEGDLVVTPHYRLLVSGANPRNWFSDEEFLAHARDLTCLAGIDRFTPKSDVTYVLVLLDDHQILCGNGAWCESLQPDEHLLATLDPVQRAALWALFPQLCRDAAPNSYPAARATLTAHDVSMAALT